MMKWVAHTSLFLTFAGCGNQAASTVDAASSDSDAVDSAAIFDSQGDHVGSDSSAPESDGGLDAATCDVPADAACNCVSLLGSDVTSRMSAGFVPRGTGGPISDGSYVLTDFVLYAGTSEGPATASATLQITGGTWQLHIAGFYAVDPTTKLDETLSYSPTTSSAGALTMTLTCPHAGRDAYDSFTATAASMTLYSSIKRTSMLLMRAP